MRPYATGFLLLLKSPPPVPLPLVKKPLLVLAVSIGGVLKASLLRERTATEWGEGKGPST